VMLIDGDNYQLPQPTFPVRQDDHITAAAPSQIIDGIKYTLSYWSDLNNIQWNSAEETFSPVDHNKYTAHYTGKPLTTGMNIHFVTAVGQPITISWDEHVNNYVTKYEVWRIVKHNGVVYPAQKIATVNRGTTSYTDMDYAYSRSSSYDLLKYDVRAYYSVDNSYSTPNYLSIFGQLIPKTSDSTFVTIKEKECKEFNITNYPNPFNPTTLINYQLPERSFVSVKIYDAIGKEVATLVNGYKPAGFYQVEFDGTKLSSGIYIYTLQTKDVNISKKMLLLK